jgi:aspartyl-tRNA(Asn)/glutamyl-tRNA(Gln) amidotransferase subunit C
MQVTDDLVGYVASLSRIKLDPEERDKMREELSAILRYMDILNSADTKEIEPLSHVFAVTNVMRKDEVELSFDRKLLLQNAPEHTDETFVVPKTVE